MISRDDQPLQSLPDTIEPAGPNQEVGHFGGDSGEVQRLPADDRDDSF